MARVPSESEIAAALAAVAAKIKEEIMRVIDAIPEAASSREQIEGALDRALAQVRFDTALATAKEELLQLLLTGQSEVDNQPSDLA